jgi:exopolyphosphatase/guanosine-5'-triphosphate,3'-diphosphate pyrophosphatase
MAAVGGTATALAMLELSLPKYDTAAIEGLEVRIDRITGQIDRLASLTLEEILALPGMDKGRADIIMPGLCLLESFLKGAGLESCLISDRGVRYGVIIDAIIRARAGKA